MRASLRAAGHDLVAVEGLVLQELFVFLVEAVVVHDIIVGGQEESPRAAGRIGDGLPGLGPDAFHHGLDQGARREVLSRAALGVFGVFLQEAFVNLALDVRPHGAPPLLVDHVDEAEELGRVLDLVLRFGEDLPEDAFLLPQLPQKRDVVKLQIRAALCREAFPIVGLRHQQGAVVGRFGKLVGELQKEKVRELFQVVPVTHAVVAQGVAEAPDLGDDARCVVVHYFFFLSGMRPRMMSMLPLYLSLSLTISPSS